MHHLEQSAREVEDLAEELEERFQAAADRYAPGNFEFEASVEVAGVYKE